MKIYIKDVKGLKVPARATPYDAGYDVEASREPNIVGEFIERPMDGLKLWKNIQFLEYETNIFIEPSDNKTHTLIFPRSSIAKFYLTLKNSIGLADNQYRGMLYIRYAYHFQPEDMIMLPEHDRFQLYGMMKPDKIYHTSDKIAQLVFAKTIPAAFELVKQLGQTERGEKGFGSTT